MEGNNDEHKHKQSEKGGMITKFAFGEPRHENSPYLTSQALHAGEPESNRRSHQLNVVKGEIQCRLQRPWRTMECSQSATWTTNRSQLVASRVNAAPGDHLIPARPYPELCPWKEV